MNRAADGLHYVIQRKAGLNFSAGAVDVEGDRQLLVFFLKMQKAANSG